MGTAPVILARKYLILLSRNGDMTTQVWIIRDKIRSLSFQKAAVRTTVGILDPPLGATRVEVVRLLAALVATGHENLLAELQRQDLLNVLLELFFQYPWNNFLHAQVEATFVAAFKSTTLFTHVSHVCKSNANFP